IKQTRRQLSQEFGREPTLVEIAEAMEIDLKKLKQNMHHLQDVLSLDVRVGKEQDTTLGELIEAQHSTPTYLELLDQSEEILRYLSLLDERQRYVIVQRYGLEDGEPKTMQDIGQQLGVSRERIRQIHNKAMKKLQKNSDQATEI
ncbi:sigma-70 family RNA polymerase sigma factor, partial [Acaryochloris marina NIES-2412]|uniref:sigma-70 family RNA polymerase sigma factor n=1 Tax=Acaryochloris marina TaxID=155978 RepID=UPI004058423B